jgi:alkylated DNA repair dioxygenase AlkB
MAQFSLFERPLPQGFAYFPEFLSKTEEHDLLERLSKESWKNLEMFGVTARRQVVHYGLDYTYESRSVSPTEAAPLYLDFLIRRVAKTLGVTRQAIAEVLLTRYPPEAGIGWHRDAPAFGDVFGISLKNSSTFKLRSSREAGGEVFKLELEPRSAYILSGEARWSWYHSIPPVKYERYSITLRTLR